MWAPRIVSITVAMLATFGMYEFATFMGLEESSREFGIQPSSLFLAESVAWLLTCVAGILIGSSGIIASFALELDGNGRFRARENWLGRSVGSFISSAQSFCGASALCGLLVMIGAFFMLAVCSLGYMAWAQTLVLLGIAGIVAFLIGGIVVISMLCKRYRIARTIFAIAGILVMLAVVAMIGYAVYTAYENLNPNSLHTIGELLAIFAAMGMVGGGLWLVQLFLKRLPFYHRICPIRASDTQSS